MKRKWKIVIAILFLVAITAIGVFEYTKPLDVDLMKVKPQTIARTFKEEGTVTAKNEYPVYSANGGRIIELSVKEGDVVKKGDLLVACDIQELLYQRQQLQNKLKSIEAQKDLQELSVDLESKRLLYEAGALSKKEYEDAKNTIDSGYYPALIGAIQAEIDLVNYQISQKRIYAPADGIITDLKAKKGMVVSPGFQLMTVFSSNSYQVEVFVLTEDASRISKGMSVTLFQDNKNGDVRFSGTVEDIAPSAVEKISALGLTEKRLKLTINPDVPEDLVLRPGYALDVEFTIDKKEDQLVVPKTALFPYGEGKALWVVKDGRAIIQPVKIGFENDRDAAISEGLNSGDLVILNPKTEGLEEGKKIKVAPLEDRPKSSWP